MLGSNIIKFIFFLYHIHHYITPVFEMPTFMSLRAKRGNLSESLILRLLVQVCNLNLMFFYAPAGSANKHVVQDANLNQHEGTVVFVSLMIFYSTTKYISFSNKITYNQYFYEKRSSLITLKKEFFEYCSP